jgi:hypothetical protein
MVAAAKLQLEQPHGRALSALLKLCGLARKRVCRHVG